MMKIMKSRYYIRIMSFVVAITILFNFEKIESTTNRKRVIMCTIISN